MVENEVPSTLLDTWLLLRYASVIELIFLFSHLHVIGVRFREDQRTNNIEIHV